MRGKNGRIVKGISKMRMGRRGRRVENEEVIKDGWCSN
jgi:hypothetical protein